MKKTYINPTTTIVEVKVENMIASSPLGLNEADAVQSYGMEVKGYNYNGRSGSVDWDDDWSE